MGFWSTLGNIGKIAGGVAGTALTGGAASGLTMPMIVNGVSSLAGNLAQGMEKGREKKNASAASSAEFKARDAAQAERALEERAQLDLQRKKFAADDVRQNYHSALQAAFGKNVQDVQATRPAGVPVISFNGGARPSALGPEGRAAAAAMYDRSMNGITNPMSFDALPAIERVAPPEYKNAGFFENLLGGAGLVGKAATGVQDRQNAAESQSLFRNILASLQQGGKTPAPGAPSPNSAVDPYGV